MERALARFRVLDGQSLPREVDLAPGDLIGRLWTAALRLDDPRISEAHALVSLRGDELKLLALRGMMSVGGSPANTATLQPGVRVRLCEGIELEVAAVELPEHMLALSLPGQGAVALTASVYSLTVEPELRMAPGFTPGAIGHVWSNGEGWTLRAEGLSAEIEEGRSWVVAGTPLAALRIATARGAVAATQMSGRIHPPVRIVAQFDTVQLHREKYDPVVIGGTAARILSVLASFQGPASWEVVAGEVWRGETADRFGLRRRWDRNLVTLRTKLREAGLRPDLVHHDGSGNIELVLLPGDEVVDLT
jgi:hypothetical protein